MKLIVHLNDLNIVNDLINLEVDGIVVGTKNFSSRGILKLEIEEIKALIEQVNNQMEIYVLVNQLYHQHVIKDLKKFLVELDQLSITGILFQDFGVLNLAQELNVHYKLMYAPDTLNTNHKTLNTLAHLGIDEAFLARELHLDEVNNIVEKCEINVMGLIHGVQYISHSRRLLLSNYLECINQQQDTDYKANFVIKVNNKEEYSHIFEDEFGTHILTCNELCTLDLKLPFDYGYIETMYLDNDYILDIISFYKQHRSLEELKLKYPTHQYDQGFFNDGTVYKIEDVRKREEHEKG